MFGAQVAQSGDHLKIYISHSRNDSAFVDQLRSALEPVGFDAVLDKADILGGESWKDRLVQLIGASDTIVFVLSPNSIRSEVCAWEVAEADRQGKRVIPVVCAPLGEARPPATLERLNYVVFYDDPHIPDSGFSNGFKRLVEALRVDLSWIQYYTRLNLLATEWESRNRPAELLLRGPDVADARNWLENRPVTAPEPTSQIRDFVRESSAQKPPQPNLTSVRPPPKPRGKRIFISYRRKDSPHVAGRICDRLERDFSESDVFFDVDKIPLGSRFRDVIKECLHQSAILLVVIGGAWINPSWRRSSIFKIFASDDEDYVRTEIELALELDIPIVPILVADTQMPSRRQLPKSICELCDLHAASVRAGRDFHLDMNLIGEKIKELRSAV